MDNTQASISGIIEDVQQGIFKFMLEIANGNVVFDPVRTSPGQSGNVGDNNLCDYDEFDLKAYFHEINQDFVIRDKLLKESTIRVGKVSNDLIKRIRDGLEIINARVGDEAKNRMHQLTPADKDVLSVFDQNFMSYLRTRLFGQRNANKPMTETDRDQYPVWTHGVEAARLPGNDLRVPNNLSQAMTIFDRVLATDVANIINGATYSKLRDYGVRIDLRLRLRPLKEAHGRRTRAMFSQAKEKRAKEMQLHGVTDEGGRGKRWKHLAIILFSKLDLELTKTETGVARDVQIRKLVGSIVRHNDTKKLCLTSRRDIPKVPGEADLDDEGNLWHNNIS
ncbi:hypothetical protein BGZ83_003759 [Gryganskiella cystojenkinii]|nr:hypothetical protein BGZ83_003759 [Gryganskiella cystojenkinii]